MHTFPARWSCWLVFQPALWVRAPIGKIFITILTHHANIRQESSWMLQIWFKWQQLPGICGCVFNRPGVAGAVLQSPPLLINSLTDSLTDPLVQISSKHCQSQTRRARELKFVENVHPTLCVMCHVSPVTSHLSLVTCHLWHVKKKRRKVFFLSLKKLDKVVELVGGGSVINGAYPI